MTKIIGIDGLSVEQLNTEIQNGGKFVAFHYCFSLVVMTFKRGSDIYFIGANQSTFQKGIKYSLLTLLCGWWGLPWGPIYTIGALFKNTFGGTDVTAETVAWLNQASAGTEAVQS